MSASDTTTEALTLIRTKLQRPRLPGDLVPRRRLLDRLRAGQSRKLTLISAQAGAGKTTLLAQWLDECPQPSVWLSLDEHDNDLIVFLSYLITAIRTVFPDACDKSLGLLDAPQSPPLRVITASLVNELDDLAGLPSLSSVGDPSPEAPAGEGLILALDDYHCITEPAIHELLSGLIEYLPEGIHLALASRTEPPLPLARLRARREMTQLRSADLRFTSEEARAFLQATVGRELSSKTTALLEEKSEGWVVGLRLAALSIRYLPDDEAFVQRFKGTSSALIVDYLTSEVLAQQSPRTQDLLLQTSILNRFCAALCEALTEISATESQEIIEWIARANLFLVPLDQEGRWYRYHHLFRDLLRHRLKQQYSAGDITALHARAGAWFAQNGLIDAALHHLLAANDTAAAVNLVARRRYALMNQAQWGRLDQYLHQFSPEIVDQYPDLLILKTWLLYHRGQYAELPAALKRIGAALAQTSLAPEAANPLQGEISALRSLVSYFALDAKSALGHAQQSLEKTPHELWIVRIMARMYLAGALLMMDDVNGAYAAMYSGFEEEGDQSNPFKGTLLGAVCNIHWIAADLQGLEQAAGHCLALSQKPFSPQFWGWGHYHLGRVRYHHNDLAAAEGDFAAVVQQPYLSYGLCYVYSACGLALTHQAQGRPEEARAVAESAVAFMLETGNITLLPVALAFQAELALMHGQVATASQWAARLDPVPPLSPMFGLFAPHLTLVKVWLAQDTPASRGQAADLLSQVQTFCESTHTTRFLIEALALQALLHDMEGDEVAALAALEVAITLAEPSGFIRLFVDLGPAMARLLDGLHRQGVAPDYIAQILAAFPELTTDQGRQTTAEPTIGPSSVVRGPSPLVEPLTTRELEVLALLGRYLTNKEIAEELVVSPSTVKTHTLNIYSKLDVRGRQEAVARAKELGILTSV